MATLNEQVREQLRQMYCAAAQETGVLPALASRIPNPAGRVVALGAIAGATALFCNRPVPTEEERPFDGGQCPKAYGYRSTISGTFFGQPFDTQVQQVNCGSGGEIFGPLSNLGVRRQNGVYGLYIDGFTSAGVARTYNVGASSNSGDFLVINNFTFVPNACDGVDNCGDPPGSFPPPPPGYNNRNRTNIPYTDDNGNQNTFDIDLTFGFPFFSIRNELKIPITTNINIGGVQVPIQVRGEFNFSLGTINLNFGSPAGDSDGDCNDRPTDFVPPGDPPPDPIPPVVPDPELPPEELPEAEPVIRGALVTVTAIATPSVGAFFQSENPDIIIPNAGYINFRHRIGRLGFAWSEDIPVKNRRQLIPCVWEGGAISISGTPRDGVEWVITPIYLEDEPIVEFPE